jgi:SsrA-binding protein
VAPFELGTFNNHEDRRLRKLLLNKQEIRKLEKSIEEKGLTIIPIKMFINNAGLCKVEIALCRGKKEYDKRETIKEKDNKRELDRIMKNYG